MKINRAPFCGETDLQAMIALAQKFPEAQAHLADLPYRLSSWALDLPENVGLWRDEAGELKAWAVLQTPFWTIDLVSAPDAPPELERQALEWANGRAQAVLGTPYGRPSWYVSALASQAARRLALEAAGFALQAEVPDDPWTMILLARPGDAPAPPSTVSKSFTIRPLAGEAEVEAYVCLHQAVFESKNMTVPWRQRTLQRREHDPELDLVAVDPTGRLAGFCIGWLAQVGAGEEVWGQVEPLGVDPAFRGLGQARALLAECLRRMGARGAARVLIETDSFRSSALELYCGVGFEPVETVLVFRRDYEP